MHYSIGEFSKLTNISIYTLRYYEKKDLIIPNRNKNGNRCYNQKDIEWIKFIKKLKDTHMSIKEIQKYSYLRAIGKETMSERMELLKKHKSALINKINDLNNNLKNLNDKIDYYEKELGI